MATGHTFHIGRLEAGQQIDLQIPAISTGGTYLVHVDPENLVSESNETNNNLAYLYATATPFVGCQPTPVTDTTPTLPPLSTPVPQSVDGLIYADMNLAQIFKVMPGGLQFKLLDGIAARFSVDGIHALFEQSGDVWLAQSWENSISSTNLTNSPDQLESFPQWWAMSPSKIVFNVVGVNEPQEKGWTREYAGYAAMIDQDGSNFLRLAESPSLTRPALSPDGMTVAYDVLGAPMLYRLGHGQQTFDPATFGYQAPLGMMFTSPSFSPDGRWLTWWVSGDELQPQRTFSLLLFDLVNRTFKASHSYTALSGFSGWLGAPVWSPNVQWLAFQTSGETTSSDLWVMHVDGGIGERFGLATNPVWSPDSQHLAFVQWPPQSDSYLAASISIVGVPSWYINQTTLPLGSIPLDWRR